MKLRPDQIEVKEKLRDALIKHRAVILEASTGFGKTTLTIDILRTVPTAWFVVHRKRLFKDCMKAFTKAGIVHGYIASGKPYVAGKGIYICMAKTLANRIDSVPEPKLVVIDEFHNGAAATYKNIVTKGAFKLYLTATPERTDGQGLGKYAPAMVSAPDMRWLIDNKCLSPYKYYAPSELDGSQLRKRAGEYTSESIDAALEGNKIHGDCIESYNKYASGKRAIVFCHSIKAAQETAAQFKAAGIPAASLESSLRDEESDEISDALESGELLVVCSVNMVLEGYDLPAIECIIWKRPSESLIVVRQGNGRGLRYIEGKTCVILDHVGNYKKHGLPDTPIKWNLEGRAARQKEATIAVRTCRKCFSCYTGGNECPECGYINPAQERVIEQTAGELMEIKQAEIAAKKLRKRNIGKLKAMCRSRGEMIILAQELGYKPAWGWKQWDLRQGKINRGLFNK